MKGFETKEDAEKVGRDIAEILSTEDNAWLNGICMIGGSYPATLSTGIPELSFRVFQGYEKGELVFMPMEGHERYKSIRSFLQSRVQRLSNRLTKAKIAHDTASSIMEHCPEEINLVIPVPRPATWDSARLAPATGQDWRIHARGTAVFHLFGAELTPDGHVLWFGHKTGAYNIKDCTLAYTQDGAQLEASYHYSRYSGTDLSLNDKAREWQDVYIDGFWVPMSTKPRVTAGAGCYYTVRRKQKPPTVEVEK